MSDEPESLMLRSLRDMRAEVGEMRADVAADFMAMRREMAETGEETGEQMVGLRRAVVGYHTSVIGHGVIISDYEARVGRIEQNLDLPFQDGH